MPLGMREALRDRVQDFFRLAQPRKIRSYLQFLEEELRIPTGPDAGWLYRVSRQPALKFYVSAVDDPQYREIVATGPSQSGKSLTCFIGVILYHLFEICEDVLVGLPEKDMARDKWYMDLLPSIERTRYREFLPVVGTGARGGFSDLIQLRHGPVLKFMSGGGSDKERAYFTTRVIVFTEIDALDKRGAGSKEARKIKQIEQRAKRWWGTRRIYKECTVTDEQGHIWQRYLASTATKILKRCPLCHKLVEPGRDALVNWQEAETDEEARLKASWSCPECGELWTEPLRHQAVTDAVPCHRGQVVESDRVVGVPIETSTFGLRWTAVDNLFISAGDVGSEEWSARLELDQDDAQRALHQFTHCIPYSNPDIQASELDPAAVMRRMLEVDGVRFGNQVVPPDMIALAIGCDVGKRYLHWTLVALTPAGWHNVDYGIVNVASDDLGLERALPLALSELHETVVQPGARTPTGDVRMIDQVWIDARWQSEEQDKSTPVIDWIRTQDTDLYRPFQGLGISQYKAGEYHEPEKIDKQVRFIGPGYYLKYVIRHGMYIVFVNSDKWKSQVHDAARMPPDKKGRLTYYHSTDRFEHFDHAKHLSAEHPEEQFIAGKGRVTVWRQHRRQNHFLDSQYAGFAACNFVSLLNQE